MSAKRRHVFARLCALFLLLVLLAAAGAGMWNATRPLPSIAAEPGAVTNAYDVASVAWPARGQAAVGAQGYGVLAANGVQAPTPTASVAKLITALAVLRQKPLSPGQPGPLVTMTANDVARYQMYAGEDGSVVPVAAGEQLSEYQILQGMLLPSANNLADTAAAWAFGSLANYIAYANKMTAQLDMAHTTVADDASGFQPATVSTAADLVRLGQAVMQEPVLANIVSQRSAVLPTAGTVTNVNALLGQNNIVGIKTGNTDQAGGCFVGAARHTLANGHVVTVIAAVMADTDLGAALHDANALLQSAGPNFVTRTPVHAGDVLGTYHLPWGGTVQAIAARDIAIDAWKGGATRTTLSLRIIHPPLASGSSVGTVTVASGTQRASQPIVLKTAVAKPPFFWRITRQ